MKPTIVILLLFILGCSFILSLHETESIPQTHYKHLQGPPEEFNEFLLPSPLKAAKTSDSYVMEIYFTESEGNLLKWTGKLPIDSVDNVTVNIVSKYSTQMNIKVLNIDNFVTNEFSQSNEFSTEVMDSKNHIVRSWFGYEKENSVPTKTFIFNNRDQIKVGEWEVEVTFDAEAIIEKEPEFIARSKEQGTKPHAYLMVFCSSPLTAHSYLNNFKLVVGENIGLTTSIIEKSTLKKTGTPLASVVSPLNFANIKAQLEIEFPNGKSSIIPMHDDGLHADLDKNDGTFGANIVAQDKGIFSLKSVVVGTLGRELTDTYYAEKSFVNDDEPIVHFIRTTQHSVVVVDEHLELVPSQSIVSFSQENEMANVSLIAKVESSNLHEVVGKKFKAYTEVWARSIKDDSLVPVCWVLGMTTANVNSELGKDFVSLDLQMSLKWLSKANAKFPLTLRNAYIQDVDTSTPIAQLSQSMELETRHVKFDSNGKPFTVLSSKRGDRVHEFAEHVVSELFRFNGELTEEMTVGVRPKEFTKRNTFAAASSSHRVLLVHGYCAGGSPFPVSEFKNAIAFDDPGASRSNDVFAQMIYSVGKQFDTFSVVAHSQGGLASLHLATFYWSNIDKTPTGVKLIQSVGSPYKGCSAAADVANLAKAFGVGCGTNYDLSPEGATKWIATIPPEQQKKVSYYTTQYKDWSWCNVAMNLVLSWPNDGTAELDKSSLPYGNNMGHTKSQCHTDNMKYPSQCKDSSRNSILNKFANVQ
ncbi:hypothetical protein ABK040_008227 [Willaertia magna]